MKTGIPNRRRGARPRTWLDLARVVAGAAIVALGFNLLLRPGGVAPGGVVGVSIVLQKFLGIEPAWTQAVLNGALLVLGGVFLGRGFLVRSALGSLLVPVFVGLTRGLPALTDDPVLAALCGGVAVGAGVGIVFQGRGSVGGFSTVALTLHRRWGWPVDRVIMMMDGMVIAGAFSVFPSRQALCALVATVLVSRTVRAALSSGDHAKLALIVTRQAAAVSEAILHEIDLGLTHLAGHGGFTGESRDILMVVMRPSDVPQLKRVVQARDPQAFLTLADASEVLGQGFKPHA